MNEDTLKGQWNQLKGSLKQQWGRLTDDDIAQLDGTKDKIIGKLQERYGIARDEAEREWDHWQANSSGL
jgi:uncharacterized protein YjbJ (UPF0337 family)